MARVNILRLRRFPILEQLKVEEALFRATKANWFVLNDGTPDAAVVLGISGKPSELVHGERARAQGIPLIKRFTGGGTVVVDEDTIFTAFIGGPDAIPGLPAYPKPIMEWSHAFFSSAFGSLGDGRGVPAGGAGSEGTDSGGGTGGGGGAEGAPGPSEFLLQENDYAFGYQKFGGNAQAISRDRFVHHTSFLFDYRPEKMALLKPPARQPAYRAGRDHERFVTRLRDFRPDREALIEDLAGCVRAAGFDARELSLDSPEVRDALERNSLCGTRVLEEDSYAPPVGQAQLDAQPTLRAPAPCA